MTLLCFFKGGLWFIFMVYLFIFLKQNLRESILVDHAKEISLLLEKVNNLETTSNSVKEEYELRLALLEEKNKRLRDEITTQTTSMQTSQQLSEAMSQELNALRDETEKRDNDEINRLKTICNEYEVHLKNETERLDTLVNLKQATIERLNEEIDVLNAGLEAEKVKLLNLRETNDNLLKAKEALQAQLDSSNRLSEQTQGLIEKTNAEHEEKISYLINVETTLREMIDAKQIENNSLLAELNALKSLVENQRLNFEEKLDKLASELKEKETKLADAIFREDSILVKSSSFATDLNESNASESNVQNMSLTSKCSHLEAQLKYCHEKCEKVVLKLNQLKKQNESLNTKIKSIKSMAFV